jgi:hypothetical protein
LINLGFTKKTSLLASVLLGFVTVLLQAGEPVAYKQLTPRPPVFWDTGFYGAIDMGANVYQNRGGDRTNESRELGQHLVSTSVRFHFQGLTIKFL